MKHIRDLLAEHRFFQAFPEKYLDVISGCGKNVYFKQGEYIAKEDDSADFFYLIRRGRAAVSVGAPGRDPIVVQTIGGGDILGWSWIFPPYRWTFDIQALEDIAAIALDGVCLRGKCDADHELGYFLMTQFARIMTNRLRATRIQLLDLYAKP